MMKVTKKPEAQSNDSLAQPCGCTASVSATATVVAHFFSFLKVKKCAEVMNFKKTTVTSQNPIL